MKNIEIINNMQEAHGIGVKMPLDSLFVYLLFIYSLSDKYIVTIRLIIGFIYLN